MVSVFSYLIIMVAGVFWFFRVVVTFMYTMKMDFIIEPSNLTFEIILLFAALILMIFIVKRKIIGGLAYFVLYGLYFGTEVYSILAEGQVANYPTLICSIIGIIIPVFIVLDILLNKDRKAATKNKKTDWFYGTDKFDREYDERADKNQYKF